MLKEMDLTGRSSNNFNNSERASIASNSNKLSSKNEAASSIIDDGFGDSSIDFGKINKKSISAECKEKFGRSNPDGPMDPEEFDKLMWEEVQSEIKKKVDILAEDDYFDRYKPITDDEREDAEVLIECIKKCENERRFEIEELIAQYVQYGWTHDQLGEQLKQRGLPPYDMIGLRLFRLYIESVKSWKVCKGKIGATYNTRCNCGALKEYMRSALLVGDRQSCGCLQKVKIFENLVGQKFGKLLVLKILGWQSSNVDSDRLIYLCKCECGGYKIVIGKSIKNGLTSTCGKCRVHRAIYNRTIFGNLIIKKLTNYADDRGNIYVEAECNCKGRPHIPVLAYNIFNGHPTSCGVCTARNMVGEKFGRLTVISYEGVKQKEGDNYGRSYVRVICDCGSEPFEIRAVGVLIGSTKSCTQCNKGISSYEKELLNLFPVFIPRDRSVLQGFELDLYSRLYKLAVEINGTYWHSAKYKDIYYHQQKTIACANKGIRLIHIFEYEWFDDRLKNKNIDYIDYLLHNKNNPYLKELNLYCIEERFSSEIEVFLIKNSLTYNPNCIDNTTSFNPIAEWPVTYDTIVVVRDDNKTVYAAIFLEIDNDSFSIFIKNFTCSIELANSTIITSILMEIHRGYPHITRIIALVDAGKFTPIPYIEAGFKILEVTEPTYVYANNYNMYYTEKGYKNQERFYKIYDCGYYKLIYEF